MRSGVARRRKLDREQMRGAWLRRLQSLGLQTLGAAAFSLRPLERSLSTTQDAPAQPIFLVGVPRSGTTLAYQALACGLGLGYLTNLHNLFPAIPRVCTLASKGRVPASRIDFSSSLGRTHGLFAPSEAGRFWRRQLPRERRAPCLQGLAEDLAFLESTYGVSLLAKNTFFIRHLVELAQAFPGATIVHVTRAPEDTAVSLLRARRTKHGTDEEWFGPEPTRMDGIHDLPPALQVCEQVDRLTAEIIGARDHLPADRWISLRFEDLCDAPTQVTTEIRSHLHLFGHRLGVGSDLPSSFPRFPSSGRSDEEKVIQNFFRSLDSSGAGH